MVAFSSFSGTLQVSLCQKGSFCIPSVRFECQPPHCSTRRLVIFRPHSARPPDSACEHSRCCLAKTIHLRGQFERLDDPCVLPWFVYGVTNLSSGADAYATRYII